MLGFSDVGSTPTASTNQQSGTIRTSSKTLEKSGVFSFVLSIYVLYGMQRSVVFGYIFRGKYTFTRI